MPSLYSLGAIMAAIAIAMGAFSTHMLASTLSPEAMAWIRTASQYLLVHGVAAMLATHLLASRSTRQTPALMLAVGALLFAFSLYIMALTGWRQLGIITPVGGLLMIAAWLKLAWILRQAP